MGKFTCRETVSIFLIYMILACGMSGISTQKTAGEYVSGSKEDIRDNDTVSAISMDGSLEVGYRITEKRDRQYDLEVTLSNNRSNAKIDDWEVFFDFKDPIEHIENAQIIEQVEGESVIIGHADGNEDIAVGGAVTFYMTLRYEGEIELPQNRCYLTREQEMIDEDACSVQYVQDRRSENHVDWQVIITNKGKKTVRDWKFEILTEKPVISVENVQGAELECMYQDEEEDTSLLRWDNDGENEDIEPGERVTFRFTAEYKGDLKIEYFFLYGMKRAECDFIDPHSEDWAPEYNLDDFDTYEEYEEYCKEIGWPVG